MTATLDALQAAAELAWQKELPALRALRPEIDFDESYRAVFNLGYARGGPHAVERLREDFAPLDAIFSKYPDVPS